MTRQILTEVSATVDPSREAELVASFRGLGTSPLPDGILRSELLRGPDNQWRIQTLWRDRATLDAMLTSTETPTARRLFQHVHAEPSLQVLELEADHRA